MGFSYSVYCGPAIVILDNGEKGPSWYDVSEATDERLSESRLEIRKDNEPRYFIPNIGGYGKDIDPRENTDVSVVEIDKIEKDINKFESEFSADIEKVKSMFPGEGRVAIKWVILSDAR